MATTTYNVNAMYLLASLSTCYSQQLLPEQLVSNNAPQFVSEEFRTFLKGNVIRHICCLPYHPSSNEAVRHSIQTFKRAMQSQKT